MLHNNSPEKNNVGTESGVVYRAAPSSSRITMSVGPVSEENHQNYRIQQAVNRYNNVPPHLLRPSSLFKCGLFKNKLAKPVAVEVCPANASRSKPETRYAAGHFPKVFLGKFNSRATKRQNILPHLRDNEPVLPISRFLDDTSDKYSELKNTRSVLDVLQDLSRKRIHGKDDSEEASKKQCKGLGGDLVQEGESLYKPLFVSKSKSNQIVKKDQTTQTSANTTLNGTTDASTTSTDPKWALRKKLALKNNEIFASLSSSINSALFAKRKRVDGQTVDKETHSTKKQKTCEKETARETLELPAAVNGKPLKKPESPRSPLSKDRLMRIYLDLQDAGDVKKNVLETLQKSPVESQFQRSGDVNAETDIPPKISKTDTQKPIENLTPITTQPVIKSVATPDANTGKTAESDAPIMESKGKYSVSSEGTSKPSFEFGKRSSPSLDISKNPTVSEFSITPLKTKDNVEVAKTELSNIPEKLSYQSKTPNTIIPLHSPNLNIQKPGIEESSHMKTPTMIPSITTPAFNLESKISTPPSFAFTSKTDTTDPPKPVFSFGLSNTTPNQEKPTKLDFSAKSESPIPAIKPVTFAPSPAFTFGKDKETNSETEKKTTETTAPFIFGQTQPATTTEPKPVNPFSSNVQKSSNSGFSFGQLKPDATTSPSGQTKTETATTSSFTLGQSKLDSTAVTSSPGFFFTPTASPSFSLGPSKSSPPLEPPKTADPPPVSLAPTKPEITASTFSFSQSKPETTASPFSFGQTKSETTASTFSFGQSKPETTTSTFSFGQNKPETTTSSFSFGQNKPETTTSSFSFGQNKPETTTSSFSFGQSKAETTTSTFSFGQPKPETKVPTSSTFSFVQSKTEATTTTQSSFSFAQSKPETAEAKPFSFGSSTSETVSAGQTTSGFSFGKTDAASKVTFAFGQTKPAEPPSTTSSGFSFSKSDSKLFSFGNNAAETASVDKPKEDVGKNTTPVVATTTTSTSSIFPFGGLPADSKPIQFGLSVESAKTPVFGESAPSTTSSVFARLGKTVSSEAKTDLTDGVFKASPAANTMQPSGIMNKPLDTTLQGATPPHYALGGGYVNPYDSPKGPPRACNPPPLNPVTTASTSTFTPSQSGFNFGSAPNSESAPLTFSFGKTTNTQTTQPFSFGNATPALSSTPFASSTPAFGASVTAPSFGTAATTAPPAFPTSTTSAFGAATPAFGTVAPAFGAASSTFGAVTTTAFPAGTSTFGTTVTSAPSVFGTPASTFGVAVTSAPPAFGTTTTPAFGATANAFGASNTTGFGSVSGTPAFGTGSFAPPAFGNTAASSGFPAAAPAPAFGATTAAPAPQFGNTGFNESNPAFGSANNSTPSFGSGFGSAPSTAGTSTPFNFSGNATSTPTFKFGANQAAPFTFGNSNSGPSFNFSGNTSGGAFSFGSNTSGFSPAPTPGPSGFQPGFGQTPSPGPFTMPATFSIGTASTQPRRHVTRSRRRP